MSNIRQLPTITAQAALNAVSTAIAEGARLGVAVSVAVVDPALGLVAFAKGDNATPHSVETSRRKANAAASHRRVTGWMPEQLAVALPMASGNLITNLGGGVPVIFDGQF